MHCIDRGETIYESASDERLLTILASGVASVTVPTLSGSVEALLPRGCSISRWRRLEPCAVPFNGKPVSGVIGDVRKVRIFLRPIYQLRSDQLSTLLARRPDMGERMCCSLSEHRATVEKLMATHNDEGRPPYDFFAWLRKGMQELGCPFLFQVTELALNADEE